MQRETVNITVHDERAGSAVRGGGGGGDGGGGGGAVAKN